MHLANPSASVPAHFAGQSVTLKPFRPHAPSPLADSIHFGQNANSQSTNTPRPARRRPSKLNWLVLFAFLFTGGGLLARPAVDQALSGLTRPAISSPHTGGGHSDAADETDSHGVEDPHGAEEAEDPHGTEEPEGSHGSDASEDAGDADEHETPPPSRADKRLAREIRNDLEDRMTIYNYLGIAGKIGEVRNDLLRAELILNYLDAAHGDRHNYSLYAIGVSDLFLDYSTPVGTLMQRYTTERDTDERADLRDEILEMVENGD